MKKRKKENSEEGKVENLKSKQEMTKEKRKASDTSTLRWQNSRRRKTNRGKDREEKQAEEEAAEGVEGP